MSVYQETQQQSRNDLRHRLPLDINEVLDIIRTNVRKAADPMTPPNRSALTLETLAGPTTELQADQTEAAPVLPAFSEVLEEFSPLPREALFLGLATDGLPVLLNLLDPLPGPLLIVGDASSGKTRLLRLIARGAERSHGPQDIHLHILSVRSNEWSAFEGSRHCSGIWSPQDPATAGHLASLVEYAHTNKKSQKFTLLLIDDLESITQMSPEAQQHLRWLFLRGPSRRVWPIATLDASDAAHLAPWLEAFRTRLFGHIAQASAAQALAGRSNTAFTALKPGT